MESLVPLIVGLAFVDSLNPFLFVAQFVLLATHRPAVRTLAYIAGVLAVNVTGGVLLLAGVRVALDAFAASLSLEIRFGLQALLGLALIGFGLWVRLNKDANADQPLAVLSLRPLFAFGLGAAVMLDEITTALPYFAAIERIVQAQLSVAGSLAAVAIYNVVFSLPLFGFLGLFFALRGQATAWLKRMNRWIAYWVPRLLKYGSLALGIGLVVHAGVSLLAVG